MKNGAVNFMHNKTANLKHFSKNKVSRRLGARGQYPFSDGGCEHLIQDFCEIDINKATTLESLAESMTYARGGIDTDNNQYSPHIRDQLWLFSSPVGVGGSLEPFVQAGTLSSARLLRLPRMTARS